MLLGEMIKRYAEISAYLFLSSQWIVIVVGMLWSVPFRSLDIIPAEIFAQFFVDCLRSETVAKVFYYRQQCLGLILFVDNLCLQGG